ncbi:MAG: MerR family transcriptional regulator [Pseudomonadota bacterium]
MAEKSRDAFRTISEVADWLEVPTHVLRFWESRFSQIKPVKRAGGRRYYRPSDMRIIGGVKVLLHDQGMTIRGVQKMFREEGLKHVSSFSPGLYGEPVEEAPLTAEALERAARPAPPASKTHDASPDPIEDAQTPEEAEEIAEAPPMFQRASSRIIEPVAAPEEPANGTVEPDEVVADNQADDETQPDLPLIPPTPDVPAEDPADDDASFAATPGIAARLIAISRDDLQGHQTALEDAATRLRGVLEKVS